MELPAPARLVGLDGSDFEGRCLRSKRDSQEQQTRIAASFLALRSRIPKCSMAAVQSAHDATALDAAAACRGAVRRDERRTERAGAPHGDCLRQNDGRPRPRRLRDVPGGRTIFMSNGQATRGPKAGGRAMEEILRRLRTRRSPGRRNSSRCSIRGRWRCHRARCGTHRASGSGRSIRCGGGKRTGSGRSCWITAVRPVIARRSRGQRPDQSRPHSA